VGSEMCIRDRDTTPEEEIISEKTE